MDMGAFAVGMAIALFIMHIRLERAVGEIEDKNLYTDRRLDKLERL